MSSLSINLRTALFLSGIFLIALFFLIACSPQSASPSVQNTSKQTTVAPVAAEHIQGKGSLTLVEYADTECSASKDYHLMLEQFMPTYKDKVRWEYKHFPLNQHMQKATLEGEAAECAGAQGKFWEYLNMIYQETPSDNKLPSEDLFTMAHTLGLNEDDFKLCIANATYNAKVKSDLADAVAAGADGAPYSVLVDDKGTVVQIFDGVYSQQEMEDIFNQNL